MTKELATIPPGGNEVAQASLFQDVQSFEVGQRMAKALSTAKLLPEEFRDSIADCMLALELSQRIGVSPFAIMQNVFPIGGRPAFKATFIISILNTCGRYTPLKFTYKGEGEKRQCTASATEIKTGEKLETCVSFQMALAEGWVNRKGSKWRTMTDQMLAYRAASFFSRLYAPELLCGMHTTEEVEEMRLEPISQGPAQEIPDAAQDLNQRFNTDTDPQPQPEQGD